MKRWACVTAVAISLGLGWTSPGRAAEAVDARTCLSFGETRETLQSHKLVQPYRAMAEASRSGAGESLGIRLCRVNAMMVYDVTLLRHDGRLVHMLVDASNGALVVPH